MLTEEQFNAWIKELRNPETKQCRNTLLRTDGDQKSYCCLGVLGHKVLHFEIEQGIRAHEPLLRSHSGYVSKAWLADSLISHSLQSDLGGMNDSGKSFPEIADFLEANKKAYVNAD